MAIPEENFSFESSHDNFRELAGEELDNIIKELLAKNVDMSYVERAGKYLSEGKTDEALKEYEKGLAENPENPIIYQCLGNFYGDNKKYDEAILNYVKALNIDNSLAFTHNNLGLSYTETDSLDEAISEFKKAIELDSLQSSFYNNLATALAGKNDFSGAIFHLKKALELDSSINKYKFNLALCYYKNKDYQDAIKIYETILASDKSNEKAIVNLIFIFKENKEYNRAIEYIDRFITDRGPSWLYYEKGVIYESLKKYEEAFSSLEKSVILEPSAKNLSAFELLGYSCIKNEIALPHISEKIYKNLLMRDGVRKEFYNNLGISLRKQWKFEEAIDVYKKGIDFAPGWNEIRQSLGNVYADLGRYDEALEEFKTALELSPSDAWACGKVGHIYQLLGQYEKAIEYFEKSLELNPTLAEASVSIGVANYYLNRFDKSEEAFLCAISLDPLNVKAHNCWIEILICQKNLKKAIERYEGELKQFPNQPILHYAYGLCSLYRYQLDKASKEIDTAIKLNPAFSEAFSLKASISYEYKKYDEAISFYERALSIDPFEASYEYSIAFIKRLKKENDPSLFSKIYTNGPASPLGKCARAFTLIDNGEIEEGKNILLEASGMDPKFSEPYFILGIIYELLHEKEKAIGCYRKSYELNPLDFDAKRAIDRLKKI